MSGLVFRGATVADLPAIIAMLADAANGATREDASLPLDPGYLAAFEALGRDPNQELIGPDRDGKAAGPPRLSYSPGLSFKGAGRGPIGAVRIAGALRGRGLGARLVDWAVERCRARGCRMVQLTSKLTRLDAHRFYERLGWEKSHAGFKLHFDGGQ